MYIRIRYIGRTMNCTAIDMSIISRNLIIIIIFFYSNIKIMTIGRRNVIIYSFFFETSIGGII